jgi:hypothetical protein
VRQYRLCPGWDPNSIPSDYKSETKVLGQLCMYAVAAPWKIKNDDDGDDDDEELVRTETFWPALISQGNNAYTVISSVDLACITSTNQEHT